MRRPAITLLWITLAFFHAVAGDKLDVEVSKWPVVPPGDRQQEQALVVKANRSEAEWVVSVREGRVEARRREDVPADKEERPAFDTPSEAKTPGARPPETHKVSDGWIVAHNNGEWGAEVWWFSPDGTAKRKISDDAVTAFFVDGERLFALQGRAHLGLTKGSVIEFKKVDGAWRTEEFAPLPEAPVAIARTDAGDHVIVTTSLVLRMTPAREMLVLAADGWGWLPPNSVVVHDGAVWVGLRGVVARCPLGRSIGKCALRVPVADWLEKGE